MRLRAAAVVLVLAASGCRTAAPVPTAPALAGKQVLEITVLDVGAGEATLVDAPRGDSLLIDGGPPGPSTAVLFTTLRRHHALPPDHVVVSHLATSTVGGLVMLLAGRDGQPGTADDTVPRGVLLDYGRDFTCTSLECLGYGTLAAGHHTTARPGDRIDLGDGVVARVMAVNGAVVGGARVKVHDAAGRSLALLLTDGAFRYLTAGALPGGGEGTADVETPLGSAVGHVDVLRVSAGGADTSTSAAFLRAVSPAVAIVSTGPGRCGPGEAVLERLVRSGARVLLTGRPRPGRGCPPLHLPEAVTVVGGPVRVRTDGQRYAVTPLTLDERPHGAAITGTAGAAPTPRAPKPAPPDLPQTNRFCVRWRTSFVFACGHRSRNSPICPDLTRVSCRLSRDIYGLEHRCAAIRLQDSGSSSRPSRAGAAGPRRGTSPGSSPSRCAPCTGTWRSSSGSASPWSRTGRGGRSAGASSSRGAFAWGRRSRWRRSRPSTWRGCASSARARTPGTRPSPGSSPRFERVLPRRILARLPELLADGDLTPDRAHRLAVDDVGD